MRDPNTREVMKLRDYVGRRVRVGMKLTNGFGSMPAGTIYTVTGYWRAGFSLKSDRCNGCGFVFYISKVPRTWCTLLERCQASRDGEVCAWSSCPQVLDGEPKKSGRHCPLDIRSEL